MTQALLNAVLPISKSLRIIDPDELSQKTLLADVDLLVIPSARSIPPSFIPALNQYLKSGGRLIACGLPLGELGVVKSGDKWTTRTDFQAALGQIKPQTILLKCDAGDMKRLERSSDDNARPDTVESVATEDGTAALHLQMPKLTGWDTLNINFDHPFASGQSITCFRAKGSENTHQLAVEWQETDGSRWIATVQLTREWKSYALPPSAFAPWEPPKGRGGPGDTLNPAKAQRFAVGLAFSHTDFARGPQEYWFADLGTAKAPFNALPDTTQLPYLDGLCPGYQFFPVHGAAKLRTHEDERTITQTELDAPANLIALQPRPSGTGYDKHRKGRWQPLLEAYSNEGDYRGDVAALIVSLQQTHPSAIAVFTPDDPGFYQQPKVQRILEDTARTLARGAFLAEGGSKYFTQPKSDPVIVGARATELQAQEHLSIRILLLDAEKRPQIWDYEDPNGFSHSLDASALTWPLTVSTELLAGGEVIDRLDQHLYAYDPPAHPHFIEARDGQFFRDGKPWKINGVNYMPSSGIGMSLADNELFEQWIGAASYDPEIVQRDLERIKKMNLNEVSAFIYAESLESGNLRDFLRRCDALDLKVNLSLRPGSPMDFEWEKIRPIIEKSKLAQNDTVFAYDLAWEPSHFDIAYQQSHYGARWIGWIDKKYGSIESAERKWGTSLPSLAGAPQVPSSSQLAIDGNWRALSIDYREFLNELLAQNYGHARELIRSVDPNQLVSFRMTDTGNPTDNEPGRLAYDFYGLKDAVDIWAPEAYGRIGDWTRVRDGRFESAYARLCNPNLPLMWAEVGLSVWDRAAMQPSAHKLDFQAEYGRDMYRLAAESGDDGLIWWWFPGGYRTNEQSDFGILNPDGTDRPISKVIREEGAKFLQAPKPPKPDVFIPISRDKDARGIYGIYEATKDAFWKAIDAGHQPGLVWDKPTP